MPSLVHPSPVERWLLANAAPEPLDSARALYERMPRQRDGQLPFVDVPYDPRREDHWADAARIADYLAHIPPHARTHRALRVLDVGPGDGWPSLPMAAERPDAEVLGVDPSPRRARACSANAARLELANARFVTADAAALPLADGSVDLVTAASSLEEASAPEAVLAELRRVLRPGGALRASYQNWRLPAPEVESVLLWAGVDASSRPIRLYTYVRRLQDPPLERRYTLELPADGEAARLHQQALEAAALGRRAYGETLLAGTVASSLGVELLERLAPHARRSTVVELRRWTTAWLRDALKRAGFAEVRATAHPGELARHLGRALIAASPAAAAGEREALEALVGRFGYWTARIGEAGGTLPGAGMIAAVAPPGRGR